MSKAVGVGEESREINVAEFLAALITCGSFAPFCANMITRLQLDNYSAKA